jgi:membrane protein
MLFFFSLIPYIPIEGLQPVILQTLENIMPENAYRILESTIKDIVLNHRGGLLSFGVIASIYFFSNGIMGLMNAFNQTSHTIETRSFLHRRLVSLILVVVLSFLVIISTGTMIATSFVLKYLVINGTLKTGFSIFLVQAGKLLVLLAMLVIAFSITYYLAPAKRGSIPFFSPGAIFGSAFAIIALQVFAFLIDNFGQQNKLYGSLGTVIVIMIWVNLITLIILIGFELNASIYDASKVQSQKSGETG